ncbi:MAG TPA: hypothetical protein VIB00_01125 [Pyrinomonadaceae bacterium]|jgi:hypothetical protein
MQIQILFLLGLLLLFPIPVTGQESELPEVPKALGQDTDLSKRRAKLVSEYDQLTQDISLHDGRCINKPKTPELVAECRASQAALNDRIAAYNKGEATFTETLKKAVNQRRAALEKQIDKDIEAMKRLGFSKRAEDFAEWEQLAVKAKTEFENEVLGTIADIAIDKVRGGIVDAFKDFDAAKAARLVQWIRARGIKPEPTALINAIERVGLAPDKARVADDAEFIVKQIEDYRNGRAAANDPTESAEFVSGLLESTISDPRVALLITEIKLTTAAVYNNASRRVARAEVERLTKLTESQLHDLHRLQKLLERHVQDLNSLKKSSGG